MIPTAGAIAAATHSTHRPVRARARVGFFPNRRLGGVRASAGVHGGVEGALERSGSVSQLGDVPSDCVDLLVRVVDPALEPFETAIELGLELPEPAVRRVELAPDTAELSAHAPLEQRRQHQHQACHPDRASDHRLDDWSVLCHVPPSDYHQPFGRRSPHPDLLDTPRRDIRREFQTVALQPLRGEMVDPKRKNSHSGSAAAAGGSSGDRSRAGVPASCWRSRCFVCPGLERSRDRCQVSGHRQDDRAGFQAG